MQYTKLDHSYWYPMSVFFMLMPYSEESILKINNRILGTVIGLFIVFFMGVFFQGTVERAILIVLLTSLMYYSTPTSWIMTMYSTCFGMVLTTMILQVEQAVILRTMYVGMAVVTAFFMNYFVFPNTVKREFQHNLNQLFDIDTKIIKEITKTLKGNIDFNVVRDLIVHSNMVSKEIKTYVSENLSEGEKEFYLHLLSINHKLIMEMEQLNGYIYKNKSDMDLENNMIIQELFNNFEEAINEIQKNYEKNELSNFPKLDKELRFSKKLDDKLYFNFLAFNCLKTVGHLTEYTSKIHAGSH
ncbi:FUSC family protein [Fusobacterium ulcerans]|nr:FUSC family protein [Fusobacterium ulcerans]MCB8563557.1 FUSC family protein [Fusobacterium ulcerans]MCB8647824.1 FUSC family protein [Fusobacterium ulcerans]